MTDNGRLVRFTALICVLGALGCGDPASETSRPPNIVIILADDLGYGDLGVTGAADIRTPNLDRLAREGVRFTGSYANAPVCSPTRVALLSGQYQQRTGIDRVLYVSEREAGLDTGVKLLPAYLKDAGYRTGIFGKWHLGIPKKHFPTRFGFDAFVGFTAGNIDYFAHTDRLDNHDLWRGEEEIHDDRYFTDLAADEAIAFIKQRSQEPFFLYLPFNAPHDPFQGPEHRDTAGDQETTRGTNRTREVFRSMVQSMDANIGRVLDEIAAQGIDEDTAVFFMSDNGGLPIVARNAPYSGFKTTLWEGGIRSPLLARMPGRFAAGVEVDASVLAMDLFATALDLAGAPMPEGTVIDSVSLLPALEGPSEEPTSRALYFRYQDPRNAQPQRAMVDDGWKYLLDEDGAEHLFLLTDDPGEQTDLMEQEPQRIEAMRAAWLEWEEDVTSGAPQLPEYVPAGASSGQ